MSFTKQRSVQLQTNLCLSSGCHLPSEVICCHCDEQYCHLCFMCHRKYLLDDMASISNQMSINRHQGISEVVSFIDKQTKDAHEQAKKLVDDAIDRIVKASQNIYTYIENRRRAKLNRLEECLAKFDQDSELIQAKLSRQMFLPADTLMELRRKYAYNMFDTSLSKTVKSDCHETQRQNERFFENYRHYHELVNLRQKWTFLQGALTTVYFPAKKDISLDKVLTFLEYRHDRVLENYRAHLSKNEECKEISLKSTEDLLNELSFLPKKTLLPKEMDNFSYIQETSMDELCETTNDPQLLKSDSGRGEDASSLTSSLSWQVEDGEEYEKKFHQLSESMKSLEKQFKQDFQSFFVNRQKQQAGEDF